MKDHVARCLSLVFTILVLGGCASYSISEREMTDYLRDNVHFEQSVGVENVMHAYVSVDDLQVKIGRQDADRISVFANTNAEVQMFASPTMGLDLDIEFSAVPEYEPESGEVFLKSLRLEQFEERSQQLSPEVAQLLKPAVSMIGYALSQQPVYKLDSASVGQSLLKSAEPNLVIKDHKLVIELTE